MHGSFLGMSIAVSTNKPELKLKSIALETRHITQKVFFPTSGVSPIEKKYYWEKFCTNSEMIIEPL